MSAQLSAFEKNVVRLLAPRAGVAAKILDAWARVPTTTEQSARMLTALAQLGLTEERAAQKVLASASAAGLLVQGAAGFSPGSIPAGTFQRLALALFAVEHYKAAVHEDATTARVVLTKPPRPCVLETKLAELGWRTFDLEPTEHAFKRMVHEAQSRVVVMTPFFDVTGALWLKELFEGVSGQVTKVLVLRSLEEPARRDYPKGFDAIAPWLAAEKVEVYNYSIPRAPGAGRETFHAKVVLCDSDIAYVGSSNVNAASLEHSMEMGVAMRGRAARDVATIVSAVLGSATRMF